MATLRELITQIERSGIDLDTEVEKVEEMNYPDRVDVVMCFDGGAGVNYATIREVVENDA
jgi:hypothetical protein